MKLLSMFSVARLIKATGYACAGLKAVIKTEAAFQLELFLTVLAVPIGCYLGHNAIERALLIGSWLLVIMMELLNTAIETTINRIGLEQHQLSGQAKDIAAAAVLIAVINAVIIWGIILFA